MDRLESIALSSHLSISPYRRSVNDIFRQTTGEEMADQFHHTMNNLHPKLKFEIEKPEITPNLYHYLISTILISKDDNLSSFEFYKKTAKKPPFVHHQSAIPEKPKIKFIRNEQKRIEDKMMLYKNDSHKTSKHV